MLDQQHRQVDTPAVPPEKEWEHCVFTVQLVWKYLEYLVVEFLENVSLKY